MCVTAVLGITHFQCVLLSAQWRETAVRTRGCTDKSLKVLGGFTGVLTIAALGGLSLDYLHTQVNTFSGSFLFLSLFELEAHYLPCWHYKLDFIPGKQSTTSFGYFFYKFCFAEISFINSDRCLRSKEDLILCLHSCCADLHRMFQKRYPPFIYP